MPPINMLAAGRRVGRCVGAALPLGAGICEGRGDGRSEGRGVDSSEGCGRSLGFGLGSSEGCGRREGLSLASFEGPTEVVGEAEDDADGDAGGEGFPEGHGGNPVARQSAVSQHCVV